MKHWLRICECPLTLHILIATIAMTMIAKMVVVTIILQEPDARTVSATEAKVQFGRIVDWAVETQGGDHLVSCDHP